MTNYRRESIIYDEQGSRSKQDIPKTSRKRGGMNLQEKAPMYKKKKKAENKKHGKMH